ncbi:MAG: S8 family serine peptidase, partial [Actinomycetes bacterium]
EGARVVNASLSGEGSSPVLSQAVESSPETLFVVAAGNSGRDTDRGIAEFPCNITAPNLLCVAAGNQFDGRASFSNFGAESVDLAAPGVNVLSTVPTLAASDGYDHMNGTSMASPHVAGVAALAFAQQPTASVADVRGAILRGADSKGSFEGLTVTGRRLNARGTLDLITGAVVPPSATITRGPTATTRTRTPGFAFASDQPGSEFECQLDGGAFHQCGSPHAPGPLPDGRHTFAVQATEAEGLAGPADERAFKVDAAPAMRISNRAVTIRNGRARVALTCPATEISGPCEGSLRLKTARKLASGGKKRRVSLGSQAFRVAAGRTKEVSVSLPRTGRRLVKRRGQVLVKATAAARDQLG